MENFPLMTLLGMINKRNIMKLISTMAMVTILSLQFGCSDNPKPQEKPKVASQEDYIVTRFSEAERKQIFKEFVAAQDRAEAEAEAKYPTEMNNIPKSQQATYDFATAIGKHGDEVNKLRPMYEAKVMEKHQLTKEEKKNIVYKEGIKKRWVLGM